jgi:hypothetical protein
VVGWTDPEGSRPWLGSLLLAYYDLEGRLVYAGRVGPGIKQAELERLWRRLQPLATSEMPLAVPPPRDSRFGSPLVLSRVHGARPELVAEVKYLTWTDDDLLRQVVYEGLREDKPAAEVRRRVPYPKPAADDGLALSIKTAEPKATTAHIAFTKTLFCKSSHPVLSSRESCLSVASSASSIETPVRLLTAILRT